jgi:hypothetical protein
MPRSLSIEKETLIFENKSATGNTRMRVPLSPQSVESVEANQVTRTGELKQLALNTPLRGKLIFGTKHGDPQDILAQILEICKSKGIEMKISPELE